MADGVGLTVSDLGSVPSGALVLLIGPPASGKSALAHELIASGAIDAEGVLSTDELRHELLGSRNDISGERAVFAELRRRLLVRMAEGQTTVVDATNLWPRRRARHIGVAQQYDRPVTAVVLSAPLDELLARNARRDRNVPPGSVVTMSRQADRLTDEMLLSEGCDVVVRLGGSPPASTAHQREAPPEDVRSSAPTP